MPSAAPALQRKRQREHLSAQVENDRTAKRRKTNEYTPRFWDTLSKVRLTRRALKEFDRRCELDVFAPVSEQRRAGRTRERLLRSDHRRLNQLASGGGPDLSALRGYRNPAIKVYTMRQHSSQSRKRGWSSGLSKSSASGKTKSTTPYSGEFEQKLVDQGVYPDGYEEQDDDDSQREPRNIEAIRYALAQTRGSLSPSRFSATAFSHFKRDNRRAKSESKAMSDVIPTIAGSKDKESECAGDVPFTRLKKFDPDLSTPKPDIYYGAKPARINRRVRHDLADYIVPSSRASLPAAPNFFLEGKSASGRADVAQNQAMYDGAIGARGMLQLQNYRKPTLAYDGNAYTMAASYCDGQLKIYATHPRESTTGGTEYYMTQVNSYAMTGNENGFRQGAAAFRNARDWTQQQRDDLISKANSAALRVSADRISVNQAGSNAEASSLATGGSFSSETSADELTLDHGIVAKRRRPAPP
ncbi:hypothetical protein BST61_g206 [Cercospora zeina]